MIKTIGILGAGTMGHSIAVSFAMHGFPVALYEPSEGRRQTVMRDIEAALDLLAGEDYMAAGDVGPALGRVTLHSDLAAAVADCDYVIESAPEVMELKQKIFRDLDAVCRPDTVLASNTSSLPLKDMMAAVSPERRERMIVNHWFNPAHLIPLVELSCFGNMPEPIFREVETLYRTIRKQTIRIRKDIPGLVANRIMQGVAREVFSLVENEVADPEDIDRALKFGPAFRYATTGQLEVTDFGGLDIWCVVGDNLLKEMDNSTCANPLLRAKVKQGKLGVKSGEGFYAYDRSAAEDIKKTFMRRLIHQLKASEYYV
ncbi:3-hydroxyacyl-CoA dehydrogenase family protein [Rhodoplanes roseus]|uniref:3-hydroxyacyl-CoA dehydrogenase n=1 Tax=Rhodoplanes roseus TaxID=29409 RepID=A0A327KT30_9BRAD|nr:3-hydroxyacyl-CoA dehydrogenase NAD-binding domain-containing protein [Rhodoplanes roseus]RAI41166.1 3-hydroxyacyl-CoA dehydrogenase [Rhodoplanes roseus]